MGWGWGQSEGASIPEGGLEPRTEREGFILAMRQRYDRELCDPQPGRPPVISLWLPVSQETGRGGPRQKRVTKQAAL